MLDHHWYRLDGDGYFNAQRFQVFLVDTTTGEHRMVYAGDTLGYFSFDFSPDSKQLVIGTNRDRRVLLRKPWNDDLLRPIHVHQDGRTIGGTIANPSPLFVSAGQIVGDDRGVIFSSEMRYRRCPNDHRRRRSEVNGHDSWELVSAPNQFAAAGIQTR